MELNKYTWNNGTQSSPIVLTKDQIKKLIAIGQREDIESNISGWITTSSRKIQKFLKYTIEQQFPNLNIVCDEELPDIFTINTSSVIEEGTKNIININTDSDITHEFLQWKYDYSDFIIDGDISEQNIKDRIRIENGKLVIDDPKENASWSVQLTLTAYPIYYNSEDFNNIPVISRPHINIIIYAKKIEDISINIDSKVNINSFVNVQVTPVPKDSTKLKGANYVYTTTTPDILFINDSSSGTKLITKQAGIANLTVTLNALNNTFNRTKSITFNVYDLQPIRFIIDQRYYNNLKDPDAMVSGNYIINADGTFKLISNNGAEGSAINNVITWLRKNTHAYVGRYTGSSGIRLKQLDDTTRKKFADGTSAIDYISNENGEFDVWVKINSDIYIKTEPWTPNNDSILDDDYILVSIAQELPIGEDETKWEKFSQYNLYGVYKACKINDKLHSLSGKKPVNNINQLNAKSKARARGNGFKIIDYKFSKLIAFLFYGYYSTLNSQTQLGYGTINIENYNYYPKITGQTDDLAGIDTNSITGNGAETPNKDQLIAGEGSDIKSNNFWHFENIQGDLTEWLDDMRIMQAKRPSNITDPDPTIYLSDYVTIYGYPIITKFGKDYQLTSELLDAMNENQRFITISDINDNITRIIQHGDFTNPSSGYIKKMCFGDHADIIVKEFGANANTGFCDISNISYSNRIAYRSNKSVIPEGGIGYLEFVVHSGSSTTSDGSRLMYEGNEKTIHIIDATETL